MTEDEMVGWHNRLNGHEFEQTPGNGEGQGSLVCCSPWYRKESDMTLQLNPPGRNYFTDGDTEAQRGEGSCPRSLSESICGSEI